MKTNFFLIFLVSSISLASEYNPYSDSLHSRLLAIAENCNVSDEVIKHYKTFVVSSNDIEMVEKVPTEIKGQEPYKAVLKDGNIIGATYQHSGPSQGKAMVYATYYKPGIPNPFYLPIDLKNFNIIKSYYQAQQ